MESRRSGRREKEIFCTTDSYETETLSLSRERQALMIIALMLDTFIPYADHLCLRALTRWSWWTRWALEHATGELLALQGRREASVAFVTLVALLNVNFPSFVSSSKT